MKYRVHVLIEMPVVVEADSAREALDKALKESADMGGPLFSIHGERSPSLAEEFGYSLPPMDSPLREKSGYLYNADFDSYPACLESEYEEHIEWCEEIGCNSNPPLMPVGELVRQEEAREAALDAVLHWGIDCECGWCDGCAYRARLPVPREVKND
tara:strand:- start:195 stop:662 length:468 start_codon:yes stop_codon:yes gene_type:complete